MFIKFRIFFIVFLYIFIEQLPALKFEIFIQSSLRDYNFTSRFNLYL